MEVRAQSDGSGSQEATCANQGGCEGYFGAITRKERFGSRSFSSQESAECPGEFEPAPEEFVERHAHGAEEPSHAVL